MITVLANLRVATCADTATSAAVNAGEWLVVTYLIPCSSR